jgi:hypothetical protein
MTSLLDEDSYRARAAARRKQKQLIAVTTLLAVASCVGLGFVGALYLFDQQTRVVSVEQNSTVEPIPPPG